MGFDGLAYRVGLASKKRLVDLDRTREDDAVGADLVARVELAYVVDDELAGT